VEHVKEAEESIGGDHERGAGVCPPDIRARGRRRRRSCPISWESSGARIRSSLKPLSAFLAEHPYSSVGIF
jgi:hypothetical protein